MRAAIDIGSNSLRLMIGEIGADGENIVMEQEVEETRLGEGCRDNLLTAVAIDRTMAVLGKWANKLKAAHIDDIRVFATSAVRDAVNQKAFVALLYEHFGWELRVLTGEEEAFYSFAGAAEDLPYPRENMLLFDIGGGSTEIIGYDNGALTGISAPLGAVRWQAMGYSKEEAKDILLKYLGKLDFSQTKYFIGVGGSITTAAAILFAVGTYRREAIQGRRIEKASLTALHARLAGLSLEKRKEIIGLPAKRADIILFGLDILLLLCEIFSVEEIHVSDSGILDGVLFT